MEFEMRLKPMLFRIFEFRTLTISLLPMKKMTSFLALAFAVLTFSASAQGELKFEKETHDFGTVNEGVQAAYEFKFTNTGNAPVVISNVQASCGCTTPDWSKTPVLPGKTGFIKASYNSAGRPGVFNKSITVTSNAATPSKVLFIKGNVEKKEEPKIVYTAEQKAKSARFTLTSTSHNFGKMEKGQRGTAKFTVKNTGKSDLVIKDVESTCFCVNHKLSKEAVKPGESATLELYYTPRNIGERDETVTIHSTDIVNEEVKLTFHSNVVNSLAPTSVLKEGNSAVPFK
jgi:hypothetical protein